MSRLIFSINSLLAKGDMKPLGLSLGCYFTLREQKKTSTYISVIFFLGTNLYGLFEFLMRLSLSFFINQMYGEYFHLTSSKVLFYAFDNDLFTQETDTMNIPLCRRERTEEEEEEEVRLLLLFIQVNDLRNNYSNG